LQTDRLVNFRVKASTSLPDESKGETEATADTEPKPPKGDELDVKPLLEPIL
jgi:hypothetical protein